MKCFSIFCGLILADSKDGESLMPNDLGVVHTNQHIFFFVEFYFF